MTKKLLIGLVAAAAIVGNGEVKQDPIFPNRYQYEDGTYIKKDPIFKNRWNQYDRSGKKDGYWRRDDLFKDRWNFKSEERTDDEDDRH